MTYKHGFFSNICSLLLLLFAHHNFPELLIAICFPFSMLTINCFEKKINCLPCTLNQNEILAKVIVFPDLLVPKIKKALNFPSHSSFYSFKWFS